MKTELSLWPNGRDPVEILPEALSFVCAYEQYVVVDSLDVRLYLERTERFDLLYEHVEIDPRRERRGPFLLATLAAISPVAGTEAAAARRMLGPVWRSQIGSGQPQRFLAGGLVARRDFERIRRRLFAELDAFAAQAERERGAELIRTAEELGLDPAPAGVGPHAWYVNCPTGRGHRAMAGSKSNQWGCGYCRIKGGPEELRAEVARRRAGAGSVA